MPVTPRVFCYGQLGTLRHGDAAFACSRVGACFICGGRRGRAVFLFFETPRIQGFSSPLMQTLMSEWSKQTPHISIFIFRETLLFPGGGCSFAKFCMEHPLLLVFFWSTSFCVVQQRQCPRQSVPMLCFVRQTHAVVLTLQAWCGMLVLPETERY